MNDKKLVTKKVTIQLTPIQLVWLHSQHEFQRIQEQALKMGHDIKFYKNNTGVQLRYQRLPEDKNLDALQKAKDQLVKIVQQNQLKLMRTSLDKDLYVRISREARKQFPRSYIIFLHYQTFQNCCRKLKEKFSITSINVQLEKLRKQNPYFCFLVAEKNKIDQIQKFTDRLLKSQVSCASTTFSQKQRDRTEESLLHYRRTMSVSSLKGSYASFNSQKDRNDLEHCRISLQPSETQQEMFQVSEVTLVNLTPAQLDRVSKRKNFAGTRVYVQNFEGNYLSMKKKLYYANRLQQCCNPQIQPVYAYSMVEGQANTWKLSLVTDKYYDRLSDLCNSIWFHSFKMKIQVFIQIAKALLCLHRSKQSYGDLTDNNVIINAQKQILLSCIIDKNIPPHVHIWQYRQMPLIMILGNFYCLSIKHSHKSNSHMIVQLKKQKPKHSSAHQVIVVVTNQLNNFQLQQTVYLFLIFGYKSLFIKPINQLTKFDNLYYLFLYYFILFYIKGIDYIEFSYLNQQQQMRSCYMVFALALFSLLCTSVLNQQCMLGCLQCPTPYTCTQCQKNYKCCSPVCSQCLNQTKCGSCVTGFSLNQTSNICYLANSCSQPNCNKCSLQNTCILCSGAFYADSYTYQCLPCNANCGACTSASYCNTCNTGYIANQGICQLCIANCFYCLSTTTCSICSQRYYLNTQNQCSACTIPCHNCAVLSTNCTSCMTTYSLVENNICIKCQNYINHCLSCQQATGQTSCLQCNSNYYLANYTQCLQCISYCASCNNSTYCLECFPAFYYNTTLNACMQCVQLGCVNCPNRVCVKCTMGTYLTANNSCQSCAANCDLCLGLNYCLQCLQNYFLKGGLCYPCASECVGCQKNAYNCLSCQLGFYQPNGNGFCLPCPLNCITCTSPQNCQTCAEKYYLNNTQCLKCSGQKCLTCNNSGICTSCINKYYLSNNICQLCMQYCESCTNSTVCLKCSNQWFLASNGTCVFCIPHCGKCPIKTMTCTTCLIGYYLFNSTCNRCQLQCIQCSGSNQCTNCIPGFYVNNGTCSRCVSPCITCYQNSNACLSCQSGYQLIAMFTCTQCQPGCLMCDPMANCYACRNGYARVRNYSSIAEQYYCLGCPQNCKKCLANTVSPTTYTVICTECQSGYTLLSNGVCFGCGSNPETQGCQTCLTNTTCSSCLYGLVLNNKTQCSAPVIIVYQSKNKTLYICLIVIFSILFVVLIGFIGYLRFTSRNANNYPGTYMEIP